jgi:hypothetical protein
LWELITFCPPSVLVSVEDLRKEPLCNLSGIHEYLIMPPESIVTVKNAKSTSTGETQSPMHENPMKVKNKVKLETETETKVLIEVCDAMRSRILYCEQGLRPPIPPEAPQWLHTLLSRCWFEEPLKRPTFEEIISILNSTVTECDKIDLPYLQNYRRI